jgi:hypothetical protein
MILNPKKLDFAKLLTLLKELGRHDAELHPKRERDWALETSKTLQAGRLEDFDLVEYIVSAFETDLAGRQDPRPVWKYSRALLALIDELDRLGFPNPKTKKVRETLSAWPA